MIRSIQDTSTTHSRPLRWKQPTASIEPTGKPQAASFAPLRSPGLVGQAMTGLHNSTAHRAVLIHGERQNSSGASTARADNTQLASITRQAPREGGWLHTQWKPSAAGVAAMETSSRRASVRSLASAFEQITNVGRTPSFRPSVKNHRAPPPPSLAKQQRTPPRASATLVPTPPAKAAAPTRSSPPPTPPKPANLTAIFAAMDAAMNSPQTPPAVQAKMSIEPRRGEAPAVPVPPPPPPMPPLARGTSHESALAKATRDVPLARSQSQGGVPTDRSALFDAIRNHGGFKHLRQNTVELSSVGQGTRKVSTEGESNVLPRKAATIRVDVMGSAAGALASALAKRGQAPAVTEGWGRNDPKVLLPGSPSDSGNSSASNSPPPSPTRPTVSQLNPLMSLFSKGTSGGNALMAELQKRLSVLPSA